MPFRKIYFSSTKKQKHFIWYIHIWSSNGVKLILKNLSVYGTYIIHTKRERKVKFKQKNKPHDSLRLLREIYDNVTMRPMWVAFVLVLSYHSSLPDFFFPYYSLEEDKTKEKKTNRNNTNV